MKRFNIYILFFILSISSSVYGQLDEFLIQSYIYNTRPNGYSVNGFVSELKNTYKFNSVFINTDDCINGNGLDVGKDNIDQVYQAAGNIGLTVVAGSNTALHVSGNFNPEAAENDIQKYSGVGSSFRNIIGYNVKDEPSLKNVEAVAPSINFLKNHEDTENLLRYVTLLAGASYAEKQYREDYVQKHIDTSSPNLLSFDHYPIMTKNDRFFHSLYTNALKSVENSIPFIYVLTPFKKSEDFDNESFPATNTMGKSIPEFNYVIYCALAYGAKGISYWPGLTHVRKKGNYNFELKFESGVLDHVKNLHSKLAENSDLLLSLNFASAYHVSQKSTLIELYPELAARFTNGNESMKEPFSVGLTNFANDPYARAIFTNLMNPFSEATSGGTPQELLITFMIDKEGQLYFWLVNKSFEKYFRLTGKFFNSVKLKDVLEDRELISNSKPIHLNPGQGKLFKVISPSSINITKTIKQENYNNSFEGLKRFKELTITNASNNPQNNPDIIFNSGATVTYVADEIKIRSAHFKEGSLVRLKSNAPTNVKPGRPRYSASRVSYAPTSIQDAELTRDQAYISPNPIQGSQINLYLDLGEGEGADVIIYDNMGNLIKRLHTFENENYIPLDNALPGIYFVHVNQGNGSRSLKVIKN